MVNFEIAFHQVMLEYPGWEQYHRHTHPSLPLILHPRVLWATKGINKSNHMHSILFPLFC